MLYAMYCLAQQGAGSSDGASSDSDSEDSFSPAPFSTPGQIPSLFRDHGYSTLGHSTLSTSNCGNPALRLFGFGAVVPDGYGIG